MDLINLINRALEKNHIDENTYEKALHDLSVYPNNKKWTNFVKVLLATCGVAFLMSGIIFFFAYNWDDLSKFLKLSLIVLGFFASLSIALFKERDTLPFNLSILASSIFVGVFFAVFGQIYQTGADAYEFFRIWMICIFSWTVISRFEWQWILIFGLLNLSIAFYHHQVIGKYNNDSIFIQMALVNTLIVAFGEFTHKRLALFKDRWIARIFMLVGLIYASSGAIASILSSFNKYSGSLIVYISLTAGITWLYTKIIKDLYMLSISFLSIIIFITVLLGKEITGLGGFFGIGIIVIGMGVGAGYALKSISDKWSIEGK